MLSELNSPPVGFTAPIVQNAERLSYVEYFRVILDVSITFAHQQEAEARWIVCNGEKRH